MLNMIRADIYRLLHTRSFWITELVITLLAILFAVSGERVGIMVDGEQINEIGELVVTGINSVQIINNTFIFYYLLPLIILVLGSEYSKGTLKNIITTGTSRSTFFFGKFFSYAVIAFVQYVWLLLVAFIAGSLIGGFGEITGEILLDQLYYILAGCLFIFAMSTITNFVLYLTKTTAVSILIAIIFPLAIFLWHTIQPNLTFLNYLDMQGAFENVVTTTFKTAHEMQTSFIGAILIIGIGLTLTNWLFNKQDF
ncbi:ABC transporter permease [Amphibacillus sp. Q70]|uniref:ABC transporter permease n=1 Tax=Amphibacillus sp. Q70 TaxID=3453416 RepID=UPI003F83A134